VQSDIESCFWYGLKDRYFFSRIGLERAMGSSSKQHSLVAFSGRFLLVLCLVYLGEAPAVSSASDWNVQKLQFAPRYVGDTEPGPLLAVSCPTASLCVAAGQYNHIADSSRPTTGQAAWSAYSGPEAEYSGPPPPPGAPPNSPAPNIKGVSCPSSGLCVAVTGSGDIYASDDPLAGASAWSHANINEGEFKTHLEGVSCPMPSFCVAVSGGPKQNNNPLSRGKVFSSHNPTGGAAAWHETQLDPSFDLRGVSCSSPSLCLAVGQNETMLVSTNPDGPPSAWRDLDSPAGPAHLQGVDCVPGLCLAGNAGGSILSSVEPAAQPPQWVARNGGGSVPITGISCPSASRCLAVDDNGDVLTSTDPTGGAEAWSFQNVLPYVPKPDYEPSLNGMFAVSCPSTELCAIAAANGTVLTSTDPFAEAPVPAGKRRARRTKRPRTILARVDGARVKTDKPKLRMLFRFYSKGRPRKFLCKRDDSAWKTCLSPIRYWFDRGRHVFRVRAVGYTGLRGPIAADRFRVYSTDEKCPCTPGSG
jgi:hypothetical protein